MQVDPPLLFDPARAMERLCLIHMTLAWAWLIMARACSSCPSINPATHCVNPRTRAGDSRCHPDRADSHLLSTSILTSCA